MCDSWINILGKYNWDVNLQHFKEATSYPSYFNRNIRSIDVDIFETKFRTMINEGGSFEIAGEVCFWKNYRNVKSRNKNTIKLLSYLKNKVNWDMFVKTVKEISSHPSYNNFLYLKESCDLPNGFAIPITFLAFYNPIEYPMVDKHIADWWRVNKEVHGYGDSPEFSQRNDGWIKPNKINWNVYIDWKTFCCDYAKKIAKNCGLNWRARDVEMAVWEAQKNGIQLNTLP